MVFAGSLTNKLSTSQRLVNKNSLTWWYVFKTSWRCLQDVFARRLEDVLKTSLRRLGKMSWRRLEEVLKTSWRRFSKKSWRHLENVLKTYGQDEYIGLDQDVFKTSSEDVWLIRIYSSSSRHLEDVFWRRRRKTSSRRLHQDECLLGGNKRSAWWNSWLWLCMWWLE